MHRLTDQFLAGAPRVRVLVVGDVMLDAYVTGHALRISPEAPVPVVSVSRKRYVPGGAANVAANVRALGAQVSLAGLTGVDEAAIRLRQALEGSPIDGPRINTGALIEDPSRVTTLKTRITAGTQQIVRFDEEDRTPLAGLAEMHLRDACARILPETDVCVVSDYAKGVVTEAFCRWLIQQARAVGKPVVVDPKSRSLAHYRGATVVTPNLKETAVAAGEPSIEDEPGLLRAATLLLAGIAPSALLVTRGEDGMSLFEDGRPSLHLPALVREVADVTGAGDTVVGVLAIGLGLGLSLEEAASLANLSAGVAVRHPGTWAVRREELAEAARHYYPEPSPTHG